MMGEVIRRQGNAVSTGRMDCENLRQVKVEQQQIKSQVEYIHVPVWQLIKQHYTG